MDPLLGPRRVRSDASSALDTLVGVIVAVVVVCALYFGREVLIPIALAVLLAFVLAPLVQLLRRARIPRVPAVLVSAMLSLTALLGLGGVIGSQLASLANELPRYAGTIEDKVHRVSQATTGRLATALQRVVPALSKAATLDQGPATPGAAAQQPIPVEVHQPAPSGFELVRRLVGPILGPLGTTAIVFVVAVFILLQQSDLRDRLIWLAGAGDVQRATQAVDDAASRLSRYFLSQLIVNSAFGAVVGAGLYLIGVPHTVVWAALAAIMRFVPFFGGLISAGLPILLAAAVDPGWAMALWTLALFLAAETFTGQVVEPFLYGRSTGLSPVSIVVAAIFWSWLWGPIGLLLSTPLSMCLLVLGRHASRLAMIEVILGDRPALTPSQSLYQRLLAGDAEECVEQAERLLQGKPLSAYYDEVAMEALRAAAVDARQGLLRGERLRNVRDTLMEVCGLLALHPDEPPSAQEGDEPAAPLPADRALGEAAPPSLPRAGLAPQMACIAAHGALDEATCALLSQLLEKHGFRSRTERAEEMLRSASAPIDWSTVDAVCVASAPPRRASSRLSYVIGAVREQAPDIPIVLVCWTELQGADEAPPEGVESVARTLRDAIAECVRLFEPATLAKAAS